MIGLMSGGVGLQETSTVTKLFMQMRVGNADSFAMVDKEHPSNCLANGKGHDRFQSV